MTRRDFLKTLGIAAGVVATIGYTGFDLAKRVVGRKWEGPHEEWTAHFKQWGLKGWVAVHTVNLRAGRTPTQEHRYNGIQYKRYSYDVGTHRVWYFRN